MSDLSGMYRSDCANCKALRARMAELEADNADFKKLIADELAETFRLFGAVGLNEADDFGTKTAIEAVRERIESIKADRDRWKAEAMAARTCLVHGNRGQPIETYEAWKSALAANERGE